VYIYTRAAAEQRCAGDTQTVGREVGRGDYKYVISRWHIKKGLNTRRHRFNGSGSEKKNKTDTAAAAAVTTRGNTYYYSLAVSRSCVFRIFRFHYDDDYYYYYYCPPSIFFSLYIHIILSRPSLPLAIYSTAVGR